MLNNTEFNVLALCIATYTTFFMYNVTGNPMLELLFTILTMVNVATMTHLASIKNEDVCEVEVDYEIYDDAPINSSDEEDDEEDDEEEEEEQQDISGTNVAPAVQAEDLTRGPVPDEGTPSHSATVNDDTSILKTPTKEALAVTAALLAAVAELSETVKIASDDLSGNIFSPDSPSFRDAPLVPRQIPHPEKFDMATPAEI
jgi:hypothetical protein